MLISSEEKYTLVDDPDERYIWEWIVHKIKQFSKKIYIVG